jgi:hypothetical protein
MLVAVVVETWMIPTPMPLAALVAVVAVTELLARQRTALQTRAVVVVESRLLA